MNKKWCILIGFKAENLKEIIPVINKLKKKFPEQRYNVMNSNFPQFDFILSCFAETKDQAHQIGLALTRKHLPQFKLLYWLKQVDEIG